MELGIWEEIRDRLDLSRLGKSTLIGIAALLILVAVFAGKNIVDAATASNFEVDKADAAEGSSADAQEARSIFVHISGAVKQPGLVELENGARVADAVKAAGGFGEDAATDSVNLARVVEDGEQVYVSTKATDQDAQGSALPAGGSATGAGGAATAGTGKTSPGAGGKVNVNTASESELEALPGIGPSTAAKIVAERQSGGSFSSVDDLLRVQGIGEKKLSSIADLVCV